MDAYALHLAMAALVGASFMAVSAYYMHRKTLTEILDFARSIDRDRDARGDSDDEAVSPAHSKKAAGEKERSQRRAAVTTTSMAGGRGRGTTGGGARFPCRT
ncbi:putative AMP deaminase [Acorus calamus]|uniref:AMP deaminase n=1 Tax=Acorus calamus TaxID=4465 RepID=A0AAV9C4T0_ACOCL|nr:putative AMP deaminase [Acorus calamus]